MKTVFEAEEALRVLRHRMGRLHAQRSLLEIVVAESGESMGVVPSGSGVWNSPSKEAYRTALAELRNGMTAVADEASVALTVVLRQLAEAEEEERVARIELTDAEARLLGGAAIPGSTAFPISTAPPGSSAFVSGGAGER